VVGGGGGDTLFPPICWPLCVVQEAGVCSPKRNQPSLTPPLDLWTASTAGSASRMFHSGLSPHNADFNPTAVFLSFCIASSVFSVTNFLIMMNSKLKKKSASLVFIKKTLLKLGIALEDINVLVLIAFVFWT
jgi:hypothetical protein